MTTPNILVEHSTWNRIGITIFLLTARSGGIVFFSSFSIKILANKLEGEYIKFTVSYIRKPAL